MIHIQVKASRLCAHLRAYVVAISSNKTTQIRLKIAGAELNVSAEDIDSNKAEERLTCDYQGDDMQMRYNSFSY
jgi:DNA polymerase III sliding clamp (beta) subunit (PCNA family)